MSSYRGRHAARHAKPQTSRARALGSALRRPAVSASLALAVVATGAAGVSAKDAGQVGPATFVLSADAKNQSQQEAEMAAADSARLITERASANAQKAANAAQADAAQKAKAEADARARKEAADKAAREKARADLMANAQADPQAVARTMLSDFGFGDDQWGCLQTLITGESSWNYLAVNSSSGAYGLFQSLPAEKMSSVADDWATNPVTQITWGLGYIKSSYGTPCGALAAWNSRSPHWY